VHRYIYSFYSSNTSYDNSDLDEEYLLSPPSSLSNIYSDSYLSSTCTTTSSSSLSKLVILFTITLGSSLYGVIIAIGFSYLYVWETITLFFCLTS
jgi:hypothetical protein